MALGPGSLPSSSHIVNVKSCCICRTCNTFSFNCCKKLPNIVIYLHLNFLIPSIISTALFVNLNAWLLQSKKVGASYTQKKDFLLII